jgi:hypothetical protein
MICKERDTGEHPETDKFAKAGEKAEEQMAFYLRRRFVDSPDIWIFNDLRFKDETGDCAQLDHLVLHRHGFIVIESKSVSTGVAVNQQGEWVRFWNRQPQGMPSPIAQARRQIDFLRRALHANRESLLRKALGIMQMGFRNCPFEILVAISDSGTIKRAIKLPEVVKADQVPECIDAIVERHRKAASFFNPKVDLKSMDGVYNFKDDEVENISRFLIDHHYPRSYSIDAASTMATHVSETQVDYGSASCQEAESTTHSEPAQNIESTEGLGICDKCGRQCEIRWGRYGYYWKCLHCDSNMAIKETCPSCRQKIKLRKERNRFYSYCDRCNTGETLYCEFE